MMFQSTRPHGARLIEVIKGLLFEYWFQSTRPHGARLLIVCVSDRAGAVSIHAPAWGATDMISCTALMGEVSIHAPAWGATASKINACIIGPFMNLCAKVIKIIGFIVLFKEIFLYLFEVK